MAIAIGNKILLHFELGNESYGLVLNDLSQIIILDNILKLPKCPPCIYGVGNYKGVIVTVVDTPYIFNKLKPEKFYIGLLNGKYSHIGLIISDKINTIAIGSIDTGDFQYNSDNNNSMEFLEGEFLIENKLIQIISANKLYNYLLESVNYYLRKEFGLLT
jgi:purine-binding chemotaxis protein CheW